MKGRMSWCLLLGLVVVGLSLPGWGRFGGGHSFHSFHSFHSYHSYHTYHSYHSSYHPHYSYHGSGYHGTMYTGGGYGVGGGGIGLLGVFVLLVLLVLVVGMVMANSSLRGGPTINPVLGCVAVPVGIFLLLLCLSNPFFIGLAGAVCFVLLCKGSDSLGFLSSMTGQSRAQGPVSLSPGAPAAAPPVKTKGLRDLLFHDPNFSLPMFREFVVLLYSEAATERAGGRFVHSRPYLSSKAERALTQRSPAAKEVRDVVVGSCKLLSAQATAQDLFARVQIEATYVEVTDRPQAFISREQWVLKRKLGVLTQPPKSVSSLSCPGCGYTGDFPANGVCPQCGRTNVKGDIDWTVTDINVLLSKQFSPAIVQSGGDEAGTNLPTRYHPDLGRRQEDFLARHPDFSWPAFWDKANQMFLKLQEAWTRRDASLIRPHETDVLYRTHLYWIELYRKQQTINALSQIQIQKWEFSNIVVDAFYESITARVFASMIDVTTDESGKVLFGDPKRPRRFTEYWTFIRRVGHQAPKGDPMKQCPSCGASLDGINQSGVCEYCDTVVTRGDFDWVLTNIEQDEVYSIDL